MNSRVRVERIESVLSYGGWNKGIFNKLCALVFALVPIAQHYMGIIQNAGFTLLILISPIIILKFFSVFLKGSINKECFVAIIPLVFFEFYTAFIHGFNTSRLFYVFFVVLLFLSIASGCVNISYFFKFAIIIGCAATIAVIIQYVTHYIFGRNLNLTFLDYLVKDDTIWNRNAEAIEGLGISSYFYRPSGFFLEPSHFFLYTFPLIGILLLSPNRDRKSKRVALFLSFGVILTTSGMGIGCVVFFWAVYYLLKNNTRGAKGVLSRVLSVRTLLILVAVAAVVFVAYLSVPFIHSSIDRIFTNDNHNAIDGRVRLARSFAQTISGRAVIFGTPGITSDLDFNLSGFFATYFKWGIVGLFFTYWFYIQGFFKLKGPLFWISMIIVVISYFTAHTHGTFYMLYFLLFLMNGYYERSREKYQIHKLNNQLIAA